MTKHTNANASPCYITSAAKPYTTNPLCPSAFACNIYQQFDPRCRRVFHNNFVKPPSDQFSSPLSQCYRIGDVAQYVLIIPSDSDIELAVDKMNCQSMPWPLASAQSRSSTRRPLIRLRNWRSIELISTSRLGLC